VSDEITPEWLRVKREIVAIARGLWDSLHRLEDRLRGVEKRVDRIEQRNDN
jgi:hypothetical protein